MKIKKSDATRARILDAANRVLREKNYSTARLADIAKAAGTHAGAMYYYYESKEALVEAPPRLITNSISLVRSSDK